MSSPRTNRPAPMAITNDTPRVRTMEAATFWPKALSRRNEKENVPRCTVVDSRLPRAENTLPRSPMAAGASTNSPGKAFKVPLMEARVAPATKLVVLLSSSASRL